MKTVGIIAEYNPFHNGHAYQIQKARQAAQADFVIVAMSGNYVQRGAPAILDKYIRAKMALLNGADFVFELPVPFATASAEAFAASGIALLDALGCIDAVSFGCETPNLPLLSSAADILAREPKSYRQSLAAYTKAGLPFPAAREKAFADYLTQQSSLSDSFAQCLPESLSNLLGSPNNILALEYLKALNRSRSPIRPLPIGRIGNGYHAADLDQAYSSATAIRRYLLTPSPDHHNRDISDYVPDNIAACLHLPNTHFLTEQDFSQALYYQLLLKQNQGFLAYADSSPALSNRILHALPHYMDYRSFCEQLKSKEVAYTRISRLLLHILLNITKSGEAANPTARTLPYLRLLGFRKEAACLFGVIKANASLPIVTKPAQAQTYLSPEAYAIFQKDIFASDLYYGILAQKSGQAQKQECRRGLIALPISKDPIQKTSMPPR